MYSHILAICNLGVKNQLLISRCLDLGLVEEVKYLNIVDIELAKLFELKAGYNPSQSRVPAGNPNGGQWADDASLVYSEEEKTPQSAIQFTMNKYGIDEIKQYENFRSQVYLDTAGHPTIGYGHKLLPGEKYANGVTKKEALEILAQDLDIAEKAVRKSVKVLLTQNQFDALTSLTYNIGAGAFANSTLLRLLNQHNHEDAADQFLVWNKERVNGRLRENSGLTKRRKRERNLFVLFFNDKN